MANPLIARLEKLEAQFPSPETVRRYWQVVCNKGEESAAMDLVKSRGFEPDNESHYLILRSLVTPAGQEVQPLDPYMIERRV